MVHHRLRNTDSGLSLQEQISELGLRLRGKHKTSQCGKGDRRRGLLFEKMEDRRLLTVIDLATLTPDQGSVIYGVDAGDVSGWNSTNAGDFNDDGYDDVVIGANRGAGAGNLEPSAGEVYVVFGGPNFPASVDLANLGSAGVTIYGADAGDLAAYVGTVSGAGDVNGDGIDDLVIGARGDGPTNNEETAGESYIIFGSRTLPQEIDLANLGAGGVTVYGAEAQDQAYKVAGVGDINADGINDVVIGAPNAGPNDDGVAYVIYGATSLPQTIDLASPGAANVTIYGASAGGGGRFGQTTASAGDFNGDGIDDFVIGNSGISVGGAVYVFLGSQTLPAIIDLAAPGTSADIEIQAANPDDQLGSRAISSAGDVNGDGKDDLLIGSTSVAEVDFIIYGSQTLPATIDLANLGSAGIVLHGVRILWGGLASEDVNGDDYDDVIIGSRGSNGVAGLREGSGTTYVVFGGDDLPSVIELTELGDTGVTIYGAEAGDALGTTVGSAGDVNGDGIGDLLIGASGADGLGNAKDGAGESYVIYGRDFSVAPDVTISIDDATVIEGGQLTFAVTLSAASGATISVNFATANGTAFAGSDYTATGGTVEFLPGQPLTQTIIVASIDDNLSNEPNETLTVALSSPVGGMLGDYLATGTITDNDVGPATKFYVVNDGSADSTFEYAANGALIDQPLPISAANSAPRGATSTAAGDKVWVVDANLNVYVYDTSGNEIGSWTASGIGTASQLQGIATDGTDIWLVDDKFNKVWRFAGATSYLSGLRNPTSSFELASGNAKPMGIVTDGSSIWIVNDTSTDKVFKYSMAGTPLGNWKLNTSGAGSPAGITIDPTGVSQSIWIVDKGTDRVYEYSNARTKTGGKLAASASFALAPGNSNPQGIADPPPVGNASAAALQVATVADDNAELSAAAWSVSFHDVAPMALLNRERVAPQDSSFTRNVDRVMASLGRDWLPEVKSTPSAAMNAAWPSRTATPERHHAGESLEYDLDSTLDMLANDQVSP